jgi:transcriptional regulator with XRE-family HTH domain
MRKWSEQGMGEPKMIITPGGEEVVMLTREDYEDLCDRLAAAEAQAALARGEDELLSQQEVMALLKAPTPLHFWRRKRGLSQEALAEALGITQAYVSELENGHRRGDVRLYRHAAERLRVTVDAVLPHAEEGTHPAIPVHVKKAATGKTRVDVVSTGVRTHRRKRRRPAINKA